MTIFGLGLLHEINDEKFHKKSRLLYLNLAATTMIPFKPSQFDDWMTIITRRKHRFRAGVSIEAVLVPSSSHHPLMILASLWRSRMCRDPDEQFTFHYQIQHWAPEGLAVAASFTRSVLSICWLLTTAWLFCTVTFIPCTVRKHDILFFTFAVDYNSLSLCILSRLTIDVAF